MPHKKKTKQAKDARDPCHGDGPPDKERGDERRQKVSPHKKNGKVKRASKSAKPEAVQPSQNRQTKKDQFMTRFSPEPPKIDYRTKRLIEKANALLAEHELPPDEYKTFLERSAAIKDRLRHIRECLDRGARFAQVSEGPKMRRKDAAPEIIKLYDVYVLRVPGLIDGDLVNILTRSSRNANNGEMVRLGYYDEIYGGSYLKGPRIFGGFPDF